MKINSTDTTSWRVCTFFEKISLTFEKQLFPKETVVTTIFHHIEIFNRNSCITKLGIQKCMDKIQYSHLKCILIIVPFTYHKLVTNLCLLTLYQKNIFQLTYWFLSPICKVLYITFTIQTSNYDKITDTKFQHISFGMANVNLLI